MAKLVIFGAGDIARLAHHYFTRDSEHEVAAFTVDREYRRGDAFLGLPLCDFESVHERYPPADYGMFVAVSYAHMNRVRAAKYYAARARGYALASYVSSRCAWLTDERAGDNCFILEDNTVQPFVRIGDNVTLWSGNHVGHDSTIGSHTFVASHVVISGHVRIGASCFIGVNATLRNGITIGDRTLIGAGALVVRDTAEGSVYLGRPASLSDKTSDEVDL